VKVDEIYLKTGASLLGVKQEGTHLEFSAEHRFLLCLISRN